MLLEDRENVLEEIELFVAGGGPEVGAIDGEAFLELFAVSADYGDAAFFSKGRIGQDHVVLAVFRRESIFGHNGERTICWQRGGAVADAVEEEVHGAEAGDAVHEFDSEQGAALELFLLRFIEARLFRDVIVRGEQEAAGAAGGVADGKWAVRPGPRFWGHDLDHGGDEGAGREVLAGAAFDVFGVLLEQTFVGIAFDVGAETGPFLLIDEIDNQAPELGGILDFVLRFAENRAEHTGALAEFFERVPVMGFEVVAVQLNEHVPPEAFWNRGWGTAQSALLISHFEEEQECELFNIVAIRKAIVP